MQRDQHDLFGGGILVALGLAVAGYAAMHYDLGTMRQMGPGFFPTALGLVLAGLGLTIAVPAWWRAGERRGFVGREVLCVIAAILIFGLLLGQLGLVVTTALAAVVASIPAPKPGIVWRLVLAAGITALTWAIFIAGLRMTIPVWPWSL